MALGDAQTRSLGLAARVAAEPQSLPEALAELLGAEIHAPGISVSRTAPAGTPPGAHPTPEVLEAARAAGTLLRLPTASGEPLLAHRPGEPFTPAESARAHRLAELAEAVQVARLRWASEAMAQPQTPVQPQTPAQQQTPAQP